MVNACLFGDAFDAAILDDRRRRDAAKRIADSRGETGRYSLECPACHLIAYPVLRWRRMPGGKRHLGAHCPECDKWIKWTPQTADWLAQAAAQQAREVGNG